MPVINLDDNTAEVSYHEVLDNRVSLLNDNKSSIENYLRSKYVLGSGEYIWSIHRGHKKKIPSYPVVEVIPSSSAEFPWTGTQAEDKIFGARVFCSIKNVEQENKDLFLGYLEGCVRTVLNHPTNLQFDVVRGSKTFAVYDSKCQTVGIGTLDQGTIYAAELNWQGKIRIIKTF